MPRPVVDPRFGETLRRLRQEHRLSLRSLARAAFSSKSHLQEFETGAAVPSAETATRLDEVLGAGGRLVTLAAAASAPAGPDESSADDPDGELEALELARRVAASDVGRQTLARLEHIVDDLATAYATTQPHVLLPRVRRHLAYVARLLDARKTLEQHRRLLVAGGWLSLLAATLNIDLRQSTTAATRLATAKQMAEHAGQADIPAWCLETRAWDRLTAGDYLTALELAQQAQALAPRGSSAQIQATAQEGRVWARMGRSVETTDALARMARLVDPLPVPDRPEHHYQYDPQKALSYTATTLAWAGDPAAEGYARDVIRQLEAAADGVARPRRLATARLDLGLALLAAQKPDEAAGETLRAITSGKVVPSNWWRATEVVTDLQRTGVPEIADLIDAMQAYGRPPEVPDADGQLPPSA